MTRGTKILLALLVFLILLVAFAAFLLYRVPVQNDELIYASTVVPVEHEWRNGVHVYIGSVQTPASCYSVSGDAVVMESYPEQVRINLKTIADDGVCTQVVSERRFKVSFHASKDAVVRAYLNNTPVLFSVREASPTKNLSEIKI